MAVVTSLTAARMLAIEAASVINGVIEDDDLILSRHDGTTINAGVVKGSKGDKGDKGDPGSGVLTWEDLEDSDLDDVVTPGLYKTSESGTLINNYPTLGAVGVLAVSPTKVLEYDALIQEFTSFSGTKFSRYKLDANPWGAWKETSPLIASTITSALNIRGAVTAPDGSIKNARLHYDTGWRDIPSSSLATGWSFGSGGFLRVKNLNYSVFVMMSGLVKASGAQDFVYQLPIGFRPSGGGAPSFVIPTTSGVSPSTTSVTVTTTGQITFPAALPAASYFLSTDKPLISFPTEQNAASSLPGDPYSTPPTL